MKKKILAILLSLAMLLAFSIPAMAATSQNVTVTATPEYIAITNAPATWTLNGITGTSVILINTTYYANPLGDTTAPSATVVDGECRFTITNTASIAIDLTLTMSDFTAGSDPMVNSDLGTNGAGTYGAYSWFSGDTYAAKVITKVAASAVGKNALAATTDIKWGEEVLTQTDAWTGGTSSTATLTITATAD